MPGKPIKILVGDCRETLAQIDDESVQCVVTSPPYWGQRDYGCDGDHVDRSRMIGMEATMEEHLANLLEVFAEVRRVLRPDGVLWLNYGDLYWGGKGTSNHAWSGRNLDRESGWSAAHHHPRPEMGAVRPTDMPHDVFKPKDLVLMGARVAMELQEKQRWWLRSEVVWRKPNPQPESVTDRPTQSFEKVFMLTKSKKYAYYPDQVATPLKPDSMERAQRARTTATPALVPGKMPQPLLAVRPHRGDAEIDGSANLRNVWEMCPAQFPGAHFAVFPAELAETYIKASTVVDDLVLDPFGGAGTAGLAGDRLDRRVVLCELFPSYAQMAADRILGECPMFANVEVIDGACWR